MRVAKLSPSASWLNAAWMGVPSERFYTETLLPFRVVRVLSPTKRV